MNPLPVWITVGTCSHIPLLSALYLNNSCEDKHQAFVLFGLFWHFQTAWNDDKTPCNNKAFDFSPLSLLIASSQLPASGATTVEKKKKKASRQSNYGFIYNPRFYNLSFLHLPFFFPSLSTL